MEQQDSMVLRSSFGGSAAAYARHRPGYAHAAVRWAIEQAPGPRVLDLGAGTGKLTASLVDAGADVVAVEPDPAMLAELRAGLPAVPALPGSAESIPLPDGSVDAVVAGHALHWFDMGLAGAEICRVLAPGGILAGLWNVVDDRVAWVSGLARVGGAAVLGARDLLSSWRATTASAHLPGQGAAHFGLADQAEFPHARVTAEALVGRIATHAGLLVLPDHEREARLGGIRAYVEGRSETADGALVAPMLTGVLRTRRLDTPAP